MHTNGKLSDTEIKYTIADWLTVQLMLYVKKTQSINLIYTEQSLDS